MSPVPIVSSPLDRAGTHDPSDHASLRGRAWKHGWRVVTPPRLVSGAWLTAILVILVVPVPQPLSPRAFGLLVVLVLGGVAVVAVRRSADAAVEAQAQYVHHLEQMAAVEELTGLANRRAFQRRLDEEFARARRYGRTLSVVMLDLDDFKALNDTLGHAAGDAALIAFGAMLQRTLRGSDLAARLGGDEFALILPESDGEQAAQVVQRVKGALQAGWLPLAGQRDASVRLTVSAGVGTLSAAIPDGTALLAVADGALYEDKHAQQRARVCEQCRTDRAPDA